MTGPEPNRWEARWLEGNTPWDAGAAAPALVALVQEGSLPGGRVLVPGAGAGYDVLALAGRGRRVTGLEVAATAVERFEALRSHAGVSSDDAQMIVEDFFAHRPAAPYDLAYDYTFLCAIEPSRRKAWAEQMADLVRAGGELVALLFPVWDRPRDEGPPYPLDPEEADALLTPYFERTHLGRAPVSHPGREGHEWLYRGTRSR